MEKSLIDNVLDKIDPACFQGADGKLRLPKEAVGDIRQIGSRKSIGEILIERKKITLDQIEDALRMQREQTTKSRLGDILIEAEVITHTDLQAALAEQFDLPFFEALPINDIDPDLVRNLTRSFCLQNMIVPISRDNYGATVAVAEPLDLSPVDDLRLILNVPVFRVVCLRSVIEAAINSVFERQDMTDGSLNLKGNAEDDDSIDGLDTVHDLLDDNEEAPVRREVAMIIRRAVAERASDIHIEPFEDRLVVRIRIDGRLRELRVIPKKFQSSVTTRIKILGRLDIAEGRIPQDGRIPLKVGGRECDVRLSTLPTKWGERIVMRIIDKSIGVRDLDKLNMPEKIYKGFESLLKQEHGIVLVTGPTGSGKTSTLASAVMHINRPDLNIITIEDPVEIILPGVGQVEVNDKAGLTFATALRSILRQDPNVILIQEIRDSETAIIAVQAAITGHLVLSTLHTNDTATAVTRLTDLGVAGYQIASSVIGVLAVRLIPTLCTACRETVVHSAEEFGAIGISPEQAANVKTYKTRLAGCPACRNTGYAGRTGIYELFIVDEAIRNYMLKSADGAGLKKLALQQGMVTLRDSAAMRVMSGQCSLEDAICATQIDNE